MAQSKPPSQSEYKADKIRVLEGLEAVRKRPAMYIGDTSERGLHHLIYEIVDNSIDESLAGHCDQIHVTIHIDNSVTVVDNGRGIPVDIHPTEKKTAAEVVLTKLHAGGKFDKTSYKVSGGLHGVGLSVVNALAENLEVEIKRDGKVYQQRYKRGVPQGALKEVGISKERGTRVTFGPDPKIFAAIEFSFDLISQRLRELAFLNRGVKITVDDERHQKKHEFLYKGGITSFVEHLNRAKSPIHSKVIYLQGEREGTDTEIALQWNDGYAENVFSFANNINTIEGGSHLIGFKSALTRTINSYAFEKGLLKKDEENLQGEDVREGLTAVISVKVQEPQFEGQTKTRLGNSEIKGIVESLINDRLASHLAEHPADTFDLISQRLRELAFLNRGVKITVDDERHQKKHEFLYKGGITSFVEHLNRAKSPIHSKVIYLQGEREGTDTEIALQWNDGYAENVFSFANNINTIEGGSHLIGFKSALTRTINSYAFEKGLPSKSLDPTRKYLRPLNSVLTSFPKDFES